KFFTFLDQSAVAELEKAVRTVPERRDAQRALAREVTTIVHGAEPTSRAEHASELLFGERITDLTADDVLAVFEDVPSTDVPADEIDRAGIGIIDLLVRAQAAPSK